MPTKKTVDDDREPVIGIDLAIGEDQTVVQRHKSGKIHAQVVLLAATEPQPLRLALISLGLSEIITFADSTVTWRAGHLEHIANLYTGNPAQTERNYADDLAVARAYSADVWEELIGG